MHFRGDDLGYSLTLSQTLLAVIGKPGLIPAIS